MNLIKVALQAAFICCLVLADDKKIDLNDIEQDTLKSEKQNENEKSMSEYLTPPGLNTEETTNYGQQDSVVQNKHQYAVEEPSTSDTPVYVYQNKNGDILRNQQNEYINNQVSSIGSEGRHTASLQRVPMSILLIPPIGTSASNNVVLYADHYNQKIPVVNYQQLYHSANSYVDQHNAISIEATEDGHSQSAEYQSGEEGNHLAQQQYVTSPQYEEQVQYAEVPVQSHGYTKFSEPSQKYASYYEAPRKQLYTQVDYKVSPPIPYYKKYSSHRVVLAPTIGYGVPSGNKPDDIPKVLSKYAHGVSHPIYSHISGNLGREHYKTRYGGNNLGHVLEQHHVPQAVSNGIEEDYRPTYNYPYVRKPTSLLDSYIPSSLQIAYLKQGLSKEPLATYDLIASQGYKYESGFTPNQLYAMPDGGVMFKNFKRFAKSVKP